MSSAARAPPPRLQGNRGFRLLLWEPEVTVYSHGRPAARPRAAPAALRQPRMGETRSRRKRGRRVKIGCICGGGGRCGAGGGGGGLLSALAAACLPRQGMKHGLGSMSPPASAPILFS